MRHVEISGKRLRLREVTVADVDALHAVYGDPTATEHLPFDPRTREEVEELVAQALEAAQAEPRRLYVLAVIDLDDGETIGVARLHIEADHPHSAEIGLGLRPDHWGRGMGTDLIRLILMFGFRDLRLHRVWGARSPANTAAQLAMLVAGMVEEGRIRHHIRARGAWRDSIVHSALEDEWEGHRDG
ncbi:RimJ/RimL family protein N-acetyltransferase [Streptosporangium album]|uniref:RimJ/RimL family protein N-acetyltransferase n=1 Tax=Streptosporangium album TaxID=47479 RepID=A0A7W7S281_9ACTN|nr:GNAT family protein [Streptosporangium album]MBB4942531.1 RimJ/RimL family protein N-acetyltransferase [Streptosporangium album]